MKAKTAIEIKIGGRKLILSNDEAHELYTILRKELRMENRFKEVYERNNSDPRRGYPQHPPTAPEWPWKNPPIICGSVD